MSHDAERRATKFTNPNFLARTADATEQTESLEDQTPRDSSGGVQRIVLLFSIFSSMHAKKADELGLLWHKLPACVFKLEPKLSKPKWIPMFAKTQIQETLGIRIALLAFATAFLLPLCQVVTGQDPSSDDDFLEERIRPVFVKNFY